MGDLAEFEKRLRRVERQLAQLQRLAAEEAAEQERVIVRIDPTMLQRAFVIMKKRKPKY